MLVTGLWLCEIVLPTLPICSMYGIFTNICPKNDPNVGKYSIHGASGLMVDRDGYIYIHIYIYIQLKNPATLQSWFEFYTPFIFVQLIRSATEPEVHSRNRKISCACVKLSYKEITELFLAHGCVVIPSISGSLQLAIKIGQSQILTGQHIQETSRSTRSWCFSKPKDNQPWWCQSFTYQEWGIHVVLFL